FSLIFESVSSSQRFSRRGRLSSAVPDGQGRPPLAGQLVVFTGKLSSLGRKDAHALVVRLGGETADDVNAKTTMLVVGAEGFGPATDADSSAVSPAVSDGSGPQTPKSHKLKRAEELRAEGAPIRIVPEEEFCRLVGVPTVQTLRRQYHSMRDLLARYRLLREDHLRYLVKCGVIQPVVRTNADTFFAFGDVAIVKQANDDLAGQASFRAVARSLIAS